MLLISLTLKDYRTDYFTMQNQTLRDVMYCCFVSD